VAALLAEQKNVDRADAVLRFVQGGNTRETGSSAGKSGEQQSRPSLLPSIAAGLSLAA
jgi:hypothetical protein